MAIGQLESECEATEDLQAELQQTTAQAMTLVEELEAEEAAQRLLADREREKEALELRHYRILDAVRDKWEPREQRALDKIDRLQEDKARWGSIDVTTQTEQLEAAQGKQLTLEEELGMYETLVGELKEQQEHCLQEKQHMEEKLSLISERKSRWYSLNRLQHKTWGSQQCIPCHVDSSMWEPLFSHLDWSWELKLVVTTTLKEPQTLQESKPQHLRFTPPMGLLCLGSLDGLATDYTT